MEQRLSEEANNGFSAVYETQEPATWSNNGDYFFHLISATFLSAVFCFPLVFLFNFTFKIPVTEICLPIFIILPFIFNFRDVVSLFLPLNFIFLIYTCFHFHSLLYHHYCWHRSKSSFNHYYKVPRFLRSVDPPFRRLFFSFGVLQTFLFSTSSCRLVVSSTVCNMQIGYRNQFK